MQIGCVFNRFTIVNQPIAFENLTNMKKKFIPFVFLPFFATAQGLHFEEGLTWAQAKNKAKTENKYIFLDCFATWCGPCKMMDKDVYPMDSVGDAFNRRFVALRIQCDSTKDDNEATRIWYPDAHQIITEYKITAYPTFLFLSPDGNIVHKGIGYQPTYDFVSLAAEALNPDKQYYTLLKQYKDGEKHYASTAYLAVAAKKLNDPETAYRIAADYEHNYLEKLNDADFCTRENLTFFREFAKNLTSKARIFGWYLHHAEIVDSIMQQKEYSKRFVNYIIFKEEINPRIETAQKEKGAPDWRMISKIIDRKFGNVYVEDNLLLAKVNWYQIAKDWKNYTKYLILKSERDSIANMPKSFSSMAVLNHTAWEIFQHSDVQEELEKALVWSNLAMDMASRLNPNIMDTKANLLYKLNKKQEALALEEKASDLAPKDMGIQGAYQKMKEGKPTW